MKKLLTGVVVLGVAAAAQASWTLLDNFDSYDNSTVTMTTDATSSNWVSVWNGTANSHIYDTDLGQSLYAKGGSGWRGAEKDLTGTDAAVLVGEVQTYYWQVKVTTDLGPTAWAYDFMMGLSPSVDNINDIDAWRDFNVMPYVNNATDTPYINADGPGTYWASMTADTWYNVWVVVDNNASAPSYDLYYSTGTDDGNLVVSGAYWRNTGEPGMGTNQDLNAIGFVAAGAAGTYYWIDNIYYADGVDTTYAIPEPATIGLIGIFGAGMLAARRRFTI